MDKTNDKINSSIIEISSSEVIEISSSDVIEISDDDSQKYVEVCA